MHVLIVCPDALGDLILRQPLFKTLLDHDYQITVAIRETYLSLIKYFDDRLKTITIDFNPYNTSDIENYAKSTAKFLNKVAEYQFDIILSPLFSRTSFDEILLNYAKIKNCIGFANKNTNYVDFTKNIISALQLDINVANTIKKIDVPEKIHETQKYAVLLEHSFNLVWLTDQPQIHIDDEAKNLAVAALENIYLKQPYAIACPISSMNVAYKNMPDEMTIELAKTIYNDYQLPTLFVGVTSEAQHLQILYEKCKDIGIPTRIWIGEQNTLPILLGLIEASTLYYGSDTGPMHMAAALDKYVLALFGGGTYPRFLPKAKSAFVAVQPLPCFGCGWDCIFQKAHCIEAVPIKTMIYGAQQLLENQIQSLEIAEGLLGSDAARHFWFNKIRQYNEETLSSDNKADFIKLRRELYSLNQQMNDKEIMIAEQGKTLVELQEQLLEKEKFIQDQFVFKTFGLSLDYLSHRVAIRFLQRIERIPGSMRLFLGITKRTATFLGKMEKAVRPRLGMLNQYEPKTLILPKPYPIKTDDKQLPIISIVTPSFRQASYIKRTLNSVLDQDYPKLEYIVQDGGSTDGTVEVLQSYADRLAAWESKPDGGQSQAINLGFAKSHGEIMAWLNSDDLLLPGSLRYVADYFAKNPDVDVVYGHRILIDEHDQEIGRWLLPPHNYEVLKWADYIPQETLFWRRSLWEKVGGIDESFRFAMDWDLLVRFQNTGAKFVRLPRYLGAFRIHASQKTSAEIGEIGFKEMNRIRERVHGYVPAWIEIRKAVAPYLLRHMFDDLVQRLSAGR